MRGDDGLSVVPSSSGNFIHNAKFVYQEDGSWKEEGSTSYYAEDGKILDFFAYYPYVEDADPTALHYDASEKMCDFMVARKEWIDARGETVNFVFKHVLAMAEAYIVGADKLYDYSVTMDNVITEAVFTLASSEGSELVSIGDERHSIEMSGTSNVFRAWLPPQTVAKETELFTASGSDVETFVHTVPQEGLLSLTDGALYNTGMPSVIVPVRTGAGYDAWMLQYSAGGINVSDEMQKRFVLPVRCVKDNN